MDLLYTIVPPEAIFGFDGDMEEEETVGNKGELAIEVQGVSMLVEPAGMGCGRVRRILSTNPQDFLDPRWQPGAMIYW